MFTLTRRSKPKQLDSSVLNIQKMSLQNPYYFSMPYAPKPSVSSTKKLLNFSDLYDTPQPFLNSRKDVICKNDGYNITAVKNLRESSEDYYKIEEKIAGIIANKPQKIRSVSRNYLRKIKRKQVLKTGTTNMDFDISWAKSTKNCMESPKTQEDKIIEQLLAVESINDDKKPVEMLKRRRKQISQIPRNLLFENSRPLETTEPNIKIENLLKEEIKMPEMRKSRQILITAVQNNLINKSYFSGTTRRNHRLEVQKNLSITTPTPDKKLLSLNKKADSPTQKFDAIIAHKRLRRKATLLEKSKMEHAFKYREMMIKYRELYNLTEKQMIDLINQFKTLVALAKNKKLSSEVSSNPIEFLNSCIFSVFIII